MTKGRGKKEMIECYTESDPDAKTLYWTCPECKEKNMEYYFTDWKWKKRFWCKNCHKVAYKPEGRTL